MSEDRIIVLQEKAKTIGLTDSEVSELTQLTNQKQNPNLTIKVQNMSDIEKDKLWNTMREKITEGLEQEGVSVDANSIKTEEQLSNYIRVLNELRKRSRDQVSVNLSEQGSKAGGSATLDNQNQQGSREIYDTSLPLDWREYPDYESMIEDLKRISEDQTNPESKEAIAYLKRLKKKAHKSKQGVNVELENLGEVARGKEPKWKTVEGDEDE